MEGLKNRTSHACSNVNIIIVNYNCWSFTVDCLSSLFKSTYQNFRIFIIDNNSSDDSCFKIKEWCKNNKKSLFCVTTNYDEVNLVELQLSSITLVENQHNSGFGAGNNIVLKALTRALINEYVWLLNPDTIVEPNVMQDLLDLAKDNKRSIVGNLIHFYNQKDKVMYHGGFRVKKFLHGVEEIKTEDNIDKIDSIAGASIFTELSTFKQLGFLPESYFMYWEETDFCTLALQRGFKLKVNSKSKIYDHVGASSNGNFLREYLYLLNGLRFYRKYYPLYLPIILISTLAKLMKAIFFEDNIKQRAIYYAHIDYSKLIFGFPIDMMKRIKFNKNKR